VSKAAAKTKARKESEGVDIRGVYYRTSTWKNIYLLYYSQTS